MKGVFAIDEPAGGRWDLALDLLRRGEPIALGQITFRRINADSVEAAVASAWGPMDRTEERARGELERAQVRVDELCQDEGFRDAVAGSPIDLVLVHDYDTGNLPLCRMGADGVEWLGTRAD
jgi:hypothetical protein